VDPAVREAEPSVAAVESRTSEEPVQVAARHADAVVPMEDEPLPTPTPAPIASFRVALRLPLERAYVMVRLNDREVFRCDFRSKGQAGTPGLVTPPIEAAAGPPVVKVWVISPDKKAADEYIVLSRDLAIGDDRTLELVFDSRRTLGQRLVCRQGS
jgi:hypothetical protein